MHIFTDVFSGDELFSDTYPIKLVNDVMWEIEGKHITRTEGDIELEGSNASAEEFDEGTESATESGVDVILNHRLVETGFGSKKDYLAYLKGYVKKVVKYLEDNDRTAEVDTFKTNVQNMIKELVPKYKDLSFYTGESMDADSGMVLILEYREVAGDEKPIIMAFKHGVNQVKC